MCIDKHDAFWHVILLIILFQFYARSSKYPTFVQENSSIWCSRRSYDWRQHVLMIVFLNSGNRRIGKLMQTVLLVVLMAGPYAVYQHRSMRLVVSRTALHCPAFTAGLVPPELKTREKPTKKPFLRITVLILRKYVLAKISEIVV